LHQVFESFTLPDKKQYVANKWVYDAKDAVIDLKGMQHKRKSPPPFVKNVLSKACDLLIQQGDLEAAMQHVKKSLMQLATHKVPITQLFERCMLSKNPDQYGKAVEEIKPKSPKELKRIKELEKQSRLHKFFTPLPKIVVESKRKRPVKEEEEEEDFMDDGLPRLVSAQEVKDELLKQEEDELSETRLKTRSVPIPAAVQVALRLNEQCPDNPRTAGSVVHLLVVESDNKEDKTKGERALEPMEAIQLNARPDIDYYLNYLKAPLGKLFYHPMIAAGLIRPEFPVWSPKLQPVSAYVKDEAQVDKEFAEFYSNKRSCADVLLEDERMVHLPKVKPDERTERVAEVLYAEVNRKRMRTNMQTSSPMSGHVREMLACSRCHMAMDVISEPATVADEFGFAYQARGRVCVQMCADCERDELLDFRARLVAHRYHRAFAEATQAKVRRVHAESLRRLRLRFPCSEKLWTDGQIREHERKHLRNLFEQEAQREVDALDQEAAQGASVLAICLRCMNSDSSSVKSCQAFSCPHFGERQLASSQVGEQLEKLTQLYGLAAEKFSW